MSQPRPIHDLIAHHAKGVTYNVQELEALEASGVPCEAHWLNVLTDRAARLAAVVTKLKEREPQ